MKTYKVDLDYEASLFDPAYQEESAASKKIIREFEYVFFLVQKEKCVLKNYKDYEKRYLDHLNRLGFSIPALNPEAPVFDYWWSHRHDRANEQLLNSKLTSARLAASKGWGFQEGAIVSQVHEVQSHLSRFAEVSRWLIKRPHSFSGIGHYQFDSEKADPVILAKVLTEPSLLEPVYDRLFDIGTTFVVEKGVVVKSFMVENFNSKMGGFLGGAGSSNVDNFKKYIFEKYNFDLSELQFIAEKIAAEYLSLGAVANIQIDSFIYKEKEQLKLYPLVEVNYRKTMGLVIQALADRFPSQVAEWKIQPAKNPEPDSAIWTKLSPEGNHFHSFVRYLSLE